MENGQMQRVIDTWNQLGRSARTVSEAFYEKLFESNPALLASTRFVVPEQAEKLTHMLSFAVTNLKRPDTLLPAARQLGKIHAALGVRESHYDAAAAPLMESLRQALGPEWTPETAMAWSEFYSMAAGALKEGARVVG
jgi:hemoglobin-like flavoprotein